MLLSWHCVKHAGVERPDEKPLHLITDYVRRNRICIDDCECSYLRRVLGRRRSKILKQIPKSRAESIERLAELQESGDDLVQTFEDGIAIICRIEDLNLLNKD